MTTIKIAGIVLNSTAMPQFLDHFHVILDTFFDTLRFNIISNLGEEINLFDQIVLNSPYSAIHLLFGCNEYIGWIYLIIIKVSQPMKVYTVEFFDAVNFISPPTDAKYIVTIGNSHINRITLYPKGTSRQINIISNI